MRRQTAGGHRGRLARAFKLPGPVGPSMPTAGSVGNEFLRGKLLQEQEDTRQTDRYLVWQTSHPYGSYADFVIHDFLLYEKKLTEADFAWLTQVNGIFLDYHFPARQMAWVVTSRQTILPTAPLDVRIATAQSAGLAIVRITGTDKETLDAAWMGLER